MIIDAHMHSFPSLSEAYGTRDLETQNMYLQRFVASSPANAIRRVEDNKVETDKEKYSLWDAQNNSPDGAYKVSFHAGEYGRLTWQKYGVDYYLQLYAINMQNLVSPPEFLIAHMDSNSVDLGILQNAFLYGDLNEYFSEIIKKNPGRFIGTIQVNESNADSDVELQKLEHATTDLGLKGLYFANERFFESNFTKTYSDESFSPFWDLVRDLNHPVFWDISAIQEPGDAKLNAYEKFLKQMKKFGEWHKRYPEIPSILVHGVPLRQIRQGNTLSAIPEDLWKIWQAPNTYLEILFPMQVSHPVPGGSVWDYPYREVHPLLEDLKNNLGVEKLVWGTDLPNTERNCTYKQARNYLEMHCDVFSVSEKEKIFGKNIMQIFNLN